MACFSCMLRRQEAVKFAKRSRVDKNKNECFYSLEELKDLAKQISSNFLTSQINIYKTDCNRFKSQIDELFKRL